MLIERSTTDRGPEEARLLIVLLLLDRFWSAGFMEIEVEKLHLSALPLLIERVAEIYKDKKRPAEAREIKKLFYFDKSEKRFPQADSILRELRPIISLEWDGRSETVKFNSDTRKNIRSRLAEISMMGSEHLLIGSASELAVKAYQSDVRFFSGCDE